jgi:Holliday junction resolvase RusA-like endonuclease
MIEAVLDIEGVPSPFVPPDVSDVPFLPDLTIDLPVPPSVNKVRKIDWAGRRLVKKWKAECNGLLVVTGQARGRKCITGRYEVTIVVDEKQTRCDIGNLEKSAVDYLVELGLVQGDSKKYWRRLVMEWGHAPHGIRVTVRAMGAA